jgi:hypothetical protein
VRAIGPYHLVPPGRIVEPVTAAATEETKRRHSVFLQDFVDVERPAREVASSLADGSTWLAPLADAAGASAGQKLVRVGPSLGEWIARKVLVRLGQFVVTPEGVIVPIRWEDARHPALFPVLDGNLEVAPLGTGQCRVVLSAAYRPPFDGVGAALDRALLHRVAESTVREFLGRLGETLVRGDEDGGGGSSDGGLHRE